jgi:sugar-specific transcriptional regulator TrmB
MELAQYMDELDFNSYEKEVILFLAGVEDADAKDIYKGTKVPKGRIYSVLNSLIGKGFVKKIPMNPRRYKIDNIKESLQNYLKAKKTMLKEQMNDIDKIELKPKSYKIEKNAPSVYTFTGREEHLSALIALRNGAKKTICHVAPWFQGTFASNNAKYRALKRGVKMRIIVREIAPRNRKNILECLRLGAEIRMLDSDDLVHLLIRDSEEFTLGVDDYKKKEERLVLLSTNISVLKIMEDYFEKLWKKARVVDERLVEKIMKDKDS